jgi:hypothetical protein
LVKRDWLVLSEDMGEAPGDRESGRYALNRRGLGSGSLESLGHRLAAV